METTAPSGLFRVKQFAERHRAEGWTEPAIRWVIFTQGQELEQAGAVLRLGTRLFIDEVKFYAWLRAGKRSIPPGPAACTRKPAAIAAAVQEAVG